MVAAPVTAPSDPVEFGVRNSTAVLLLGWRSQFGATDYAGRDQVILAGPFEAGNGRGDGDQAEGKELVGV